MPDTGNTTRNEVIEAVLPGKILTKSETQPGNKQPVAGKENSGLVLKKEDGPAYKIIKEIPSLVAEEVPNVGLNKDNSGSNKDSRTSCLRCGGNCHKKN